jgi:hypothetical protein
MVIFYVAFMVIEFFHPRSRECGKHTAEEVIARLRVLFEERALLQATGVVPRMLSELADLARALADANSATVKFSRHIQTGECTIVDVRVGLGQSFASIIELRLVTGD